MNKNSAMLIFGLAFTLLLFPLQLLADKLKSPELLLANVYDKDVDVSQYWVSEKYDGVRAYWDGKQFLSRQGNQYYAPAWFTQGFPDHPLDGELWLARESFEQLLSTVKKQIPQDEEWQKVSYQVFELPKASGTFTARLKTLEAMFEKLENPHIKLIPQYRLDSHKALMAKLDEMVKAGAEGLMLHHQDALYRTGRSDDLLKVKSYQDAEARVIKHLAGKGKYQHQLGALLLETPEGKQFRVGTGFSDAERKQPPPIGALVTYKFFGKTRNGIPRFASFLRVRVLAH